MSLRKFFCKYLKKSTADMAIKIGKTIHFNNNLFKQKTFQ